MALVELIGTPERRSPVSTYACLLDWESWSLRETDFTLNPGVYEKLGPSVERWGTRRGACPTEPLPRTTVFLHGPRDHPVAPLLICEGRERHPREVLVVS